MLLAFILSVIVLIYAAMSVDMNRKCKSGATASEKQMIGWANTTMLLASIAAVVYSGYHLFVPAAYKAKAADYF